MLKRALIRWLLYVFSLGSGVALFLFLMLREDVGAIVESLSSFGLLAFLGFLTISTINFTFYAWRWQIIINAHLPKGQRVGLARVFIDRMAGFSASYLTPVAQVGGEPVRIALLSSRNGNGEKDVTIKQATSSVLLDVAFELTAYVAFIASGAVLAAAAGLGESDSVMAILISMGVLLAGLLAFFVSIATGKGFFRHILRAFRFGKIKRLKRPLEALVQTEEMMTAFLRGNPWTVFVVVLLSLLVISFRVVEVFYISSFFNVSLTFGQAFLMSTLPGVALLLPVPAGVGVLEGSFAALFTVFAIPLNPIAFTLVIRSRDLVFIFAGLVRMLAKGRSFVEQKVLHADGK